ncbi:hypothetical protein ACHAWF_010802, partial [Thalassiosira exigua]
MTGVTPNENDVLFGRGSVISFYPGNQRLRSIAQTYKSSFQSTKKKEKRIIAQRIVDDIGKLDPPGRFLIERPEQDEGGGGTRLVWIPVPPEKAVGKVMHHLRDKNVSNQGPSVGPSISNYAPLDAQARGPQSLPSSDSGSTTPNMLQSVNSGFLETGGQAARHDHSLQHISNRQHMDQLQLAGSNNFLNRSSNWQAGLQPNIGLLFGSPDGSAALFPEMNRTNYLIQQVDDRQHAVLRNIGIASLSVDRTNSLQQAGSPALSFGSMNEHQRASLSADQTRLVQQASAHGNVGSTSSAPSDQNFLHGSKFPAQPSNRQLPSIPSIGPSTQDQKVSTTEPASDDPPIDHEDAACFDALVKFVFDEKRGSPAEPQHRPKGIALRQWMDMSEERSGNIAPAVSGSAEGASPYVESAMSVALELARFLLKSESDGNPIQLGSIASNNVIVFVDPKRNDVAEAICQVEITRCPGDNSGRGGDMPRLFALGTIFYELFSRRPFPIGSSSNRFGPSASASMGGLSLTNEPNETHDDPPSKRSQHMSTRSKYGDIHRESIAQLVILGIPRSLCALIDNLLDCSNGEFCGDDAYRSLADVCTDLELMRDGPTCFLHGLPFGANPSFEIRPKFYGRNEDILKIQNAYHRHVVGNCGGTLVSGGAGVGKSSLVSYVTRKLAVETNRYFLEAKFDQSKAINPLNTIGGMFNALCDSFAKDAAPSQLTAVATSLESALGSQAALLTGVIPNLAKLTSCSSIGTSMDCVDIAASMQFLFGKLLEVLSHHKGITFFLDDLQWADPASLMLIARMMSDTKGSGNVFFACCNRDDDMRDGDPFTTWLTTINMSSPPKPLEMLHLRNISQRGVNELVSETLRLFPRLTRPLAAVLHHKTRGNPLFLRQLLELLNDQGYINFSVTSLRWTWDMEKIMDLELSDDVLAMMMKEMQSLPADQQLGLKVASCFGSFTKYSIFDILSQDLGVNLKDLLDQVAKKGFMVKVDETCTRFSHDKIQQAAYEMMSMQERLENHIWFGLAICSRTLGWENDELLFAAINQINRGARLGADCLPNSKQKVMVAELNLKAGKRSIELSDFSTALKLFEHGISFLDQEERWTAQYKLSLDLFDAAAEVACNLNDPGAVKKLSQEVGAHAKCDNDNLNCLYAVTKSLLLSLKVVEAKKAALQILEQMGERVPRPSDDDGLVKDMKDMKAMLGNRSDESILNMKETDPTGKDVFLLNIYHDLHFLFRCLDPTRIVDASLRMVQITLSNGLCCISPLAFAHFSILLVTEDAALGYRISSLALRLLDRIGAKRYASAVILLVKVAVSWVAEPLQSISESLITGYKHGQRCGDLKSASGNYIMFLENIYLSGQNLSSVRDKSRKFALELLQRKQQFAIYGTWAIYLQACAFMEGLGYEEQEGTLLGGHLPSWYNIILASNNAARNSEFLLMYSSQQ